MTHTEALTILSQPDGIDRLIAAGVPLWWIEELLDERENQQ